MTDAAGRSRRLAWVGKTGMACAAVAFALLAAEAALRFVPGLLPAGGYGSGRFQDELGTNVHAGPALYNKVRRISRAPNSEGFMDAEHARAKPPGVVRVGFFGDSYTEAVQVPLETAFFRQFAAHPINGARVEALGFGISGWGTLHSLRAYQVFGRAYELDLAVYVFVENDLGDQLREVAERMGGSSKPLASLMDGGGYAIDAPPASRDSLLRSRAKWLQGHSLLAQVAWGRGLALRRGAAAGAIQANAGVPDANELAASWPPEIAAHAKRLGALVLADFARDVRADAARFAVLYVPRGEEQLNGATRREDTFAPWLFETCASLEILCIDPSAELSARSAAGEAMYDDHWSPAGHAAIARVLRRELAPLVRQAAAQ